MSKRHGPKPGVSICPILGQMTFQPPVLAQDKTRVIHWGGPKGYSDNGLGSAGFYGTPKSSFKSAALNPIHTGGMHFPQAESVTTHTVKEDGVEKVIVKVGNVQHDEHRPKASEERKKQRAERKNAKERIKRRVLNRAIRLLGLDHGLGPESAERGISLALKKVEEKQDLSEHDIMCLDSLEKASQQIRSLLARLPQASTGKDKGVTWYGKVL